jgi:hypothetical protein
MQGCATFSKYEQAPRKPEVTETPLLFAKMPATRKERPVSAKKLKVSKLQLSAEPHSLPTRNTTALRMHQKVEAILELRGVTSSPDHVPQVDGTDEITQSNYMEEACFTGDLSGLEEVERDVKASFLSSLWSIANYSENNTGE